jgi:hypothetical protein
MLLKKVGFTLMKYTFYIIFSALILGGIFYVVRQLRKRITHNKYSVPVAPIEQADELADDFMCIMKADGSTIASSGGIVVRGRKLQR